MSTKTNTNAFCTAAEISASCVKAALSRLQESHWLPPNSTRTRLFSRLAVLRAVLMLSAPSTLESKTGGSEPRRSAGPDGMASAGPGESLARSERGAHEAVAPRERPGFHCEESEPPSAAPPDIRRFWRSLDEIVSLVS